MRLLSCFLVPNGTRERCVSCPLETLMRCATMPGKKRSRVPLQELQTALHPHRETTRN